MRTAKQIASLAVLSLSGIWLLIGFLIFLGTAWTQLTQEIDTNRIQRGQEGRQQWSADPLLQLSEQFCTGAVLVNGDFTDGPDFRFTWGWAADGEEREMAYRRATCQFMIQVGRPPMQYEASKIAQYFVDPGVELAGHFSVGTPLWLMSLAAVRTLYTMYRDRRRTEAL